MNKPLQAAMHTSRSTVPKASRLRDIIEAERTIAQMSDGEFEVLGSRIRRETKDGFLRLWHGLALASRGRHSEACEEFLRASELGCNNWRVGWYLAQSAKEVGNLPLVDEACAAVLRASPEFWFARELPKHARGFYAQGDHDKIIGEFFEKHPPRARVFVEVGAFDGVHYSNVRRLVEKHGWSGVSIEPVSKNYAKLAASYQGRNVRCFQACASDLDGEVELNVSTYPHLPDWGSDVASISGEDTERWRKQYGAVWTKEKVPVRRLTGILDEAGITDVDLLSVDAEGHDLEVLRGLDFDRFKPQLIVVEYGRQREAIAQFLQSKGYSLTLDNKQDLFMAQPGPLNTVRSSAGIPSRPDRFTPKERERIKAAIQCRDCDDVPKVPRAGEVLAGDPPVQLMHNGVKIFAGSYHGEWMTEIIRQLRGHHEPQEEKVFHEVLKAMPPDAVMIEAGSFWAYYSMWFQQAVPGAQNHLIEPNAGKFALSQRHFELNGMKGVFTNGFIGRESKPDSIFTDWDNRRCKLPQIAIDDYIRQHNIPFVHVLHADIQGAELDLLLGCKESISQNKIGCFFLSTHGDRHAACLEFLRKHGFQVVAEHTIAESAAADGLIVACSPVMKGVATVPISKQTKPIASVTDEPRALSVGEVPAALEKLNPHLLKLDILPLRAGIRYGRIDPLRLVTPERFDLVVKHFYARHRALGVESGWAKELYRAHIGAFSNGTFREGDGQKNSIEDYLRSFSATLDSIAAMGFDPQQSLVPVGRGNVIIDGAHRVAACLLHRQPVSGLFFDFAPNTYGADYFGKRGLGIRQLDAVALEYCRLKTGTFIATLFPAAQGRDAEVRAILNSLGRVVYEKQVTLNRHGALNLIKQIYVGEKWLGDWSNNFGGAAGKADPCFRGTGPVRVIVFEAADAGSVKEAKARIRDMFGIGNHSVHINDTHEQTIYLGGILLNDNSVHFLNHARPRHFERFHRHLALYSQMLAERRLNPDHFCVDGSAVMAAYGIRDAQDLDFLHYGCDDLQTGNRDLSSHNSEVHHHLTTRDDIIFNPDNHFHYFGIKFATIDVIRRLKVNRNEGKDQKDVAAIDRLVGGGESPQTPGRTAIMDAALLAPKRPSSADRPERFEFSNDWFGTHQPHWDREITAWAKGRGPIDILEIGSYEGRSSCWFLSRIMDNPRSAITCVDAWEQRSGERVYEESMEQVFQRFVKNCKATGRDNQVTVHRGPSRAVLPTLPEAGFDLIYVDGDHSAAGVHADTLDAFRLLRPGGLLLWDDYYWAATVKEGVDKACAELGITVTRLGNNASFTKPMPSFTFTKPGARIVALVPARNEGAKIAFCFHALAKFADAIVYLDDCSDDGETLPIVEALATECRVERIVRKATWHRDEPGDRNALLKAGREIRGTHFIVIDADEAFTANCADGETLRRKILSLQPGDQLAMTWIQLWRSPEQYRFDNSVWTNNAKAVIFCDDGKCSYSSEFIHTPRVPANLTGRTLTISGYKHGLLHFQFVNWRNLLVKQAWYRCIERVREPRKPAAEINKRYAPSKDESGLGLKPSPAEWFTGYSFIDSSVFDAPDTWREAQILGWFEQYGRDYFQELDIWDVEWGGASGAPVSRPTPATSPARRAGRHAADASAPGKPADLAQEFIDLAEQCFNRGDIAVARDHLERAIDVSEGRADLLIALANLDVQLNAPELAQQHLRRAVELNPEDAGTRTLLASVCLKLRQVEEFEQALGGALRLDPNEQGALRLLAGLNLEHGRFKDAAQFYFKLLQQNESDIDSLLGLGVCFFKAGDRASATMTFERILQLQPAHTLARENLAACRGARAVSNAEVPAPVVTMGSAVAARPEISLAGYFQPPAGSTEQVIAVKPVEVAGPTQSAYQALKDYQIRDFGSGLDAARDILAHILRTKLKTNWSAQNDFWAQSLVLPVRCEIRTAAGRMFDETKPANLDQLGLKFAAGEEARRTDIELYVQQLRSGADLGRPLYVTGALLKKLAPGSKVDPKAIYMMDGARRITASALAHRRSIDALLLMHEDEYTALLQPETIAALRTRLASLKWFESYQSIPMLGLRGERTLRRFDLMSLPQLRDAVVMDFGCNTGQACLKAVQAGARQVIGIEGMPDTLAGAQEIARLAGFANLRYVNVNFNDADFARQIDAIQLEPVDYAFFFSVYRTKELTQREQLFRYILSKARKGVFFEGHASAKIDTIEYYEWLFESFGVKGKFLGHSEGELRPLFYIDLAARQSRSIIREESGVPSVARKESVAIPSRAMRGVPTAVESPASPASVPLVSAIVSTYNNERFMEGRLRDLVSQTLGERLEIIVVDSGSQQNEGAIVRRFMEKHPNIRYIRTEERERIYQAWNRGIRAARGKFITNANTDDRLRPDALEILAGELESNPTMALVYADFFITNTENEDFHAHTRTGYSIKPDFAPDIMLDGCHMGPQPMWRRSLHDELGWFDESLFAAGDYEFWCRVATKHPMLHLQEFLGLYLHNAAGICNSNASRTEQETAQVRGKYRSQFPAPPANLPRGFYFREAVKPGRFVNIGMVTFNRLEFTKRAIPALLECTDFPYVLTVVDNASTDGTREYLTALNQLGVIKNLVLLEENVGVAKASNLAWSKEPSAEFYLKLDNDIVIQKPGWLRKMAEVLEAVPRLGAVAYSFEPVSFPAQKLDGKTVRVKPEGNLGGACILIPKRTERALGYWCEDYGLYGEEDLDYGIRIRCQGWLNAYMEDENVGIHLPNGRAAVICRDTMDAKDGLEEVVDREYRQFKDNQRRQQVLSGKRDRYVEEYRNGRRKLYVSSGFVAKLNASSPTAPAPLGKIANADGHPLRIAVYSLDEPSSCCAKLRLLAPLGRIARPCEVTWGVKFTKQGMVVDDSLINSADLIVLQRLFPGPETQGVLEAIWNSRKPVVFELDDWFFDMPSENPFAGAAQSRLPQLQQVLQRAEMVTVPTEEFRQRLAKIHSRVVVLPNLVDERQWSERATSSGKRVIIGYAGTGSHTRDLAMIEDALERIAAKHPERVGFVFMGCATERLARLPHSRCEKFQPGYEKYLQALQDARIDIAVAPLTDNAFNRCKSGIKWLEYSAAGIAGVFADLPPYQGCVTQGETGMLAGASADDWFRAIDELVTNESKRKSIAARARELVMRDHSLAAKALLWEAAYTAAVGRAQAPATIDLLAPSRNGKTPRVSIVIPTFNNLALTKQCLAALYQTTPAALAQIIIVDNGSTDGSVPFFEAEQNAGRLRAVLNPQNLGFARGCNQGALEARGEFVLFLNNDTQTQTGWLEAMLNAAREPQVGVVGCKLLYPEGTIQHAGIEFINGVPDHRFRHAPANAPEVNQRRELDMVTGACFLMSRKLFLELGGFDEIFRNGVEDVDLCLRVRTAGHKVVYEPQAVVIHHEGKTQGRFNHVSENLKIFFARWKGQFDEQHRLRLPKKPRLQKSEKSLLLAAVSVCWDGSFLDLGSLSHVNRELTAALAGHPQIQLTRLGKNAVPKPLAGMKSILDCARQLRAQPPKPAQATVRHAWPPNWERPTNGAWVLIQPWEFGSLPKDWVQNLSHVDEVWVPSEYVRRVYVDSGVEARKVHVVPNGINPDAFRPDAKPMALATKKSFKFLFVGGTILRKGPDVLLKAYLDSFTAEDDVCLVIKDFGGQSVYAGQTFEAQVKAAQARPNAPEILYLNDELPPEALPGLYTACDCLVHPYRGEGFGLPVLEAMACGLPVVVTAGGATDDFAMDEIAYRVPSIRKIFGSKVSGMELVKPGWMLEPDHPALVERMKWIAAHRDEAKRLGRAAGEHVRREWTWERAARIAAARLHLLNERPRGPLAPTTPRKAKPIELPACAKLGHLGEARDLFRAGKLLPAWNSTVVALKSRPYHPEAFLLLAEIALAAGDSKQAKDLAAHASRMAPKWKPAREFAKVKRQKTAASRVELPSLPVDLQTAAAKPRLSVFLITKNEERFIGQCLESVQGIASQIVVMDTGSSDWTKSIADRFGAEVCSFDWCDDFSAARNAAMERVTGDWVLMLDADEELLPDQKEKLRKLMSDPSAIAWRLPMIDKGREEEGVSHVPRLFRNAPGLFYVGRIHEQIFSSVEVRRQEWGLENKFGDATLLHHGYTKEMVQSRDKIARNLRLLQLAIEELPGEPNLLMNLGLELVRDGRLSEGLEQYAAALAAMSALPVEQVTPELRESLLTQYASHLIAAKKSSGVVGVLQSTIARSGGLTASMHWLLGLAFIEQKQFAEGAAQMRECLAKRGGRTYAPANRNILKGGPNHCLALCLAAMKQRDAADKAFQQALEADPGARSVRFDYARFLAEGGQEVESLKWLHQLAAEDASDARVWQFGGQLALSKPEFLEFACDWTGEAIRLHAGNAAIVEQRATALLLSGKPGESLSLWRELNTEPAASRHAAMIICKVHGGERPKPISAGQTAAVSHEFISWYRRLLGANAESVIAVLNGRMDMLRSIVPDAARLLEAAMAEAGPMPVK